MNLLQSQKMSLVKSPLFSLSKVGKYGFVYPQRTQIAVDKQDFFSPQRVFFGSMQDGLIVWGWNRLWMRGAWMKSLHYKTNVCRVTIPAGVRCGNFLNKNHFLWKPGVTRSNKRCVQCPSQNDEEFRTLWWGWPIVQPNPKIKFRICPSTPRNSICIRTYFFCLYPCGTNRTGV